MKSIVKTLALLLSLYAFHPAETMSQNIPLPPADKSNPTTLMQALEQRHTGREFSPTPIGLQQLSDILWCANGVNRDNGRRTAPSAINCQEIEIYAFMEEGVYQYLPEKHLLKIVKKGDYRDKAAMQPFAKKAPLLLIFVANYDKMERMDENGKTFYGATDAGFVSQNVYLYCAAANLECVVLGSIQRDEIAKLIPFKGKAILGQAIGFAAE